MEIKCQLDATEIFIASNKICNKNHLLHLVGILFPHINVLCNLLNSDMTGWIHHDWNIVLTEVHCPITLKLFYWWNRCLKSNMILKLTLDVLYEMSVLFLKKLRCWRGSSIFWWIWWSDLVLVGAFVMSQEIELNSSCPLYRLGVVAGRNCHNCGITPVRLNGSSAASSYIENYCPVCYSSIHGVANLFVSNPWQMLLIIADNSRTWL